MLLHGCLKINLALVSEGCPDIKFSRSTYRLRNPLPDQCKALLFELLKNLYIQFRQFNE